MLRRHSLIKHQGCLRNKEEYLVECAVIVWNLRYIYNETPVIFQGFLVKFDITAVAIFITS